MQLSNAINVNSRLLWFASKALGSDGISLDASDIVSMADEIYIAGEVQDSSLATSLSVGGSAASARRTPDSCSLQEVCQRRVMLDFLHFPIWVPIVGSEEVEVEVDGLSIRGCLHKTTILTYQAPTKPISSGSTVMDHTRPYCVQKESGWGVGGA